MAQQNRRLMIGYGVTNPTWCLEADEDVWNEALKILCLSDYVPQTNKAGLTRYHHTKWRHNTLTASDMNHLFRFDSYSSKIHDMAKLWQDYRFPRHLDPEDIMRVIFELLDHLRYESNAQIVTKEKS